MSALDKQEGGSHYKDMPIQPIEFITKNKLDWYQGNIIKYASRHHNKGGADDLRKVIHYAELALEAQYGKKALEETIAESMPLDSFKRLDIGGQKTEAVRDDGWVEWHGGYCPVGDDVWVHYRCRGGSMGVQRAGLLTWHHNQTHHGDIVAYKIMLTKVCIYGE